MATLNYECAGIYAVLTHEGDRSSTLFPPLANTNEGETHMSDTSLPAPELNVTPLIDVMLVLLTMLILTVPVITHAIKLDMPVGASDAPKAAAINLDIDSDGRVYWNGTGVADGGQSLKDRFAQPELAKAGPLGFNGHVGTLTETGGARIVPDNRPAGPEYLLFAQAGLRQRRPCKRRGFYCATGASAMCCTPERCAAAIT